MPQYHMPKSFEWPKPSVFPFCTLALLIVNASCIYLFLETQINVLWLFPFWALNGFFLWAEIDIYQREKRNYQAWRDEVAKFFEEDKITWKQSLALVRRDRKNKKSLRTR